MSKMIDSYINFIQLMKAINKLRGCKFCIPLKIYLCMNLVTRLFLC